MARKSRRKPRELSSFAELPGNHPNAYGSYVFVERFAEETTEDLLDGVLKAAAAAAASSNGLGVHEGGAEIHLPDGRVLEAIGFGPRKESLRTGADIFAKNAPRIMAFWADDGRLQLNDGHSVNPNECDVYVW